MSGVVLDAMNGSRPGAASTGERDVRVIAFYLPQFHPIPENDVWWGKGFTEWTNVRKAKPNFAGHYQPHIPGELGYYDLRDPAVRERQAALARQYGVYGFCYYYYWFNGKRLLERPLQDMLSSGRPDFPFCVCWANENWTRRWDGLENDVLIAQHYSIDDSREFVRSLFPLFRDARYIRVNGRPLLLIYKAALIPDLAQTVAMWRDECRVAGLGEIYVVATMTTWHGNASALGLDGAVEFPPHGHMAERIDERMTFTNPRFSGMVFNLRNYVAQLLTMPRPDFKLFRALVPCWDNTPRQQDNGTTFIGSSPELFGYWLEQALHQTRVRHQGDERMIFINAWNEWGEGCHLEPDQRYGHAYLEAIASALAAPSVRPPARPRLHELRADIAALEAKGGVRKVGSPQAGEGYPARRPPRVSVIMPAYNHERFVRTALESVVGQTFDDLEIIVIDDGSTDTTGAILDAFAAECASHPVTVVHQPNKGAHAAINHGLVLARGEFVSLINSDDLYAPARLAKLLSSMDDHGAAFAFSGTRFVDDDGVECGDESYVSQLRDEIARCKTVANPLYALLHCNVAISSGNFCFRRELLEEIGGFGSFRVCHDWDFILAATYLTPIRFVHESLYVYRLHQHNTFAGLRLLGHREADQVLASFFERIERHPAILDPSSRQPFLNAIRRRGLGGFLPAAILAAS